MVEDNDMSLREGNEAHNKFDHEVDDLNGFQKHRIGVVFKVNTPKKHPPTTATTAQHRPVKLMSTSILKSLLLS